MSTIVEALSWTMATEICRRGSPSIKIRETHGGGRQIDCLALIHEQHGELAILSRTGSVRVLKHTSGATRPGIWQAWDSPLTSDIQRLVNELSQRLGQPVPVPLPPITPRVVVYRVIGAVLAASALGDTRWESRSGYVDLAGYGVGVADWFASFPGLVPKLGELTEPDARDTAVQFWFLLRKGQPVACLHEMGMGWPLHGAPVDLFGAYTRSQRVWPLVHALVADSLD